jgi:hypothetical protein
VSPRPCRSFLVPLALVAIALFPGCRAASGLLFEPAPTDPLDGYKGSLAEAGINTEMDWGPKQNHLLSEFKTLKEAHTKLERRVEQLLAENQNLTARLSGEAESLQQEKALRAQAEAEAELLRQKRRHLETRILALSIEKAKLEQADLKGRIDSLTASIEQAAAVTTEAAAPAPAPPRGR